MTTLSQSGVSRETSMPTRNRRHRHACGIAVLLAAITLACADRAWALPAGPPLATQPAAQSKPVPLRRPTSWSEAWAALAPYRKPAMAAVPCGVGPTAAAVCGEANVKSLWAQWKSTYRVQYKTTAVETLRYGYFKRTVQSLILTMSTCPKSVWGSLNARADWSPNELRLSRKVFVPTRKPGDAAPIKGGPLPSAWDWRRSTLDRVSPAKDQGRCGSCFAFAAVAAIESKLLIQYDKKFSAYPIDVSEQQVIDCANARQGSYRSDGCQGGYLEDGMALSARGFLTKEELYPFTSGKTGLTGTCNKSRIAGTAPGDKIQLVGTGFHHLRQWSATALKEAVAVAPVVVGMHVPDGSMFDFYSGGLLSASSYPLPPGPPDLAKATVNHAVLVVGWNSLAKPPYWIIKNSYGSGEKWGENGFGNIEMLPDNTYGAFFMYYYMVAPTELVPTHLPAIPEPAKTSVRLVNPNPANTTAGRVEVKHNGQWGTVCDDAFNNAAGTVVCRQLGLGTVGIAMPGGSFGEGLGKPLWLDEVQCRGNEERLESCAHAGWGVSNCGHRNDVGVVCKTEPPVTARLVNATSAAGRVSGRLELLRKGSWVPVCTSGFSNSSASVICKQLRLGTSGYVAPSAPPAKGSSVRLRSISCVGSEASWEACRGATWATAACDAQGEAGITCVGAAPSIRLVNAGVPSGSRVMQGRLEVKLPNGNWSTVCDDSFSDVSAGVACRQLGLSSTGYAVPGAAFGEGTGVIAWDGVACKGSEASLHQCPRAAKVDCTHREDVGVYCLGSDARVTPAAEKLRLDNGTQTSGRLTVLYQGVPGTVCYDGFTPAAANVACRQLGLPGPGVVLARGFAGAGTGPIWLDDLKCTGSEATLGECQHTPWGIHNCWHSNDVAISCGVGNATPPLRLVNGTRLMGRLEIRFNEQYGTVCADEFGWSFNAVEAEVACRQLGLPTPALAIRGAVFGAGSAAQPIWLNNVVCFGNELKLEGCSHNAWGDGSCPGHFSDVGVACNATVDLRLVNGTNGNSGRLELAVNGLWGTAVASKQFDSAAASVVCRQLGLPSPGRTLPGGYYGPGPAGGPLWLRYLFCTGSEARLQDCRTGVGNGLLWGVAPEERYDHTAAVALACGFP